MNKYACNTPSDHCSGSLETMNNLFSKTKNRKLHVTSEDAFKCYERHLLSTGHERIGSREFRQPNGEGILVLTKKCRYGGRMRLGKEGNRYVPKSARKSMKHGLIVG